MSRTAIVTGARGAIGSALVDRLCERGWRVVGLDLAAETGGTETGGPETGGPETGGPETGGTETGGPETGGPETGGTETGGPDLVRCDVTDAASVAAAVPLAIERLGGRLDALVNNAGIGGPASAGAPPDEHVQRMIDVNVLGAWRVTAAAIDRLVESRGQVVFVASRMAFIGLPLGAAYGVSKRALVAYADALRAEYGSHVGVTCVHPAFIRTPIHDRTRAAGLNLEGFSREEPIDGVVDKLVRACEGRGRRDTAITRAGAAQLAVARHLPGLVDRVVARTLAKRVAAGELDDAAIAAGLRTRHGRS